MTPAEGPDREACDGYIPAGANTSSFGWVPSPPAPGGPGRLVAACTTPGHLDGEHRCVTITKDWPPPAPGGEDTDLRAEAIRILNVWDRESVEPAEDCLDALLAGPLALARPDADRDEGRQVKRLEDEILRLNEEAGRMAEEILRLRGEEG